MLGNYKIGTRLVGGLTALCVLMLGIAFYVRHNFAVMAEADEALYVKMTRPIADLFDVIDSAQELRIVARDMLRATSAEERGDLRVRAEKASRRADEKIAKIEPTVQTKKGLANFAEFKKVKADYDRVVARVAALVDEGRIAEAEAALKEGRSMGAEMREALDEISEEKADLALEAERENQALAASVTKVTFAIMLGLALLAMVGGLFLSRSITDPLKKLMHAADRLAAGDVEQTVDHISADETGQLADSFRQTLAAIRSVTGEMGTVIASAKEGKLDVRGDTSRHRGAYAALVNGLNESLEAIVAPLRKSAGYIDRIARGDVPERIDDAYRGEFAKLIGNVNTCSDSIRAVLGDVAVLARAAGEGRLGHRADPAKHQGAYADLVRRANGVVDSLVGILDVIPSPGMVVDEEFTIRYMNRAAAAIAGTTPQAALGMRCYQLMKTAHCNTAQCATEGCLKRNQATAAETEAHPQGKDLSIKYEASPIRDENGKVVAAWEAITDLTAIKAAEKVMKKQAEYQSHEVGKLIVALQQVSQGKLEIDTSVEETDIDTRDIGENFKKISAALQETVAAISALARDARRLAEEAVRGNLSSRVDVAVHRGEFRRVVEGLNDTLEAILGPVHEAVKVLEALAQQDLRARIEGELAGDHARLKTAVNRTGASLHDALVKVADAIEEVTAASTEVASTSQSVAQGASQQAAALEQTSSQLEEMAGMTRQSAENTQQANALAVNAKDAADKGSAAMQRMNEAMANIRSASEGTAEIIRDINEIAFQTNLLALNAAVEAARAGDAGRGFAVVADEVRSLAQRAKEAAKKTDDLIQQSVRFANQGDAISRDVGGGLGQIVESIGRVTAIVGEIAAASQEERKGIEQISKAVVEMDRVTQQAAGSAEEGSSASEELSGQALSLSEMIGTFKLNRGARKAKLPRQTAPAPKALTASKEKPAQKGAPTMHLKPEDVIPLEGEEGLKEF